MLGPLRLPIVRRPDGALTSRWRRPTAQASLKQAGIRAGGQLRLDPSVLASLARRRTPRPLSIRAAGRSACALRMNPPAGSATVFPSRSRTRTPPNCALVRFRTLDQSLPGFETAAATAEAPVLPSIVTAGFGSRDARVRVSGHAAQQEHLAARPARGGRDERGCPVGGLPKGAGLHDSPQGARRPEAACRHDGRIDECWPQRGDPSREVPGNPPPWAGRTSAVGGSVRRATSRARKRGSRANLPRRIEPGRR